MTFLIPPIRKSKSCGRCGLRYPGNDDECPHCEGLTESELMQLKEETELREKSLRDLAYRLYLVAAIVAVITLMLLL